MTEGNLYMIQVVEDGAVSFSRKYDNALDAVHDYDRFTDFGHAKWQREIVSQAARPTANLLMGR